MPLTIDEVRNLKDPQRSYKWEVVMPLIALYNETPSTSRNKFSVISSLKSISTGNINVNTLAGLGVSGVADQVVRNVNPSVLVEEVQGVPFSRIDSEAFYERGAHIYFPGLVDIDRMTIVFYQDESNAIPAYIDSWKQLIIKKDGTRNLPDLYKQTILIRLLSGLNEPVLAYRLHGVFPTVTTPYNLDNSSQRLNFIQEFSVDSGEYTDLSKEESSLTTAAKNRRLKLNTIGTAGDDILRQGSNLKELAGTSSFFHKGKSD